MLSSHIKFSLHLLSFFDALSGQPSWSVGSGSSAAFADCLCVSPGIVTPSPGAGLGCVACGAFGSRGAAW